MVDIHARFFVAKTERGKPSDKLLIGIESHMAHSRVGDEHKGAVNGNKIELHTEPCEVVPAFFFENARIVGIEHRLARVLYQINDRIGLGRVLCADGRDVVILNVKRLKRRNFVEFQSCAVGILAMVVECLAVACLGQVDMKRPL